MPVEQDVPWHHRWWAAAIFLWIPVVFWYGLYVFVAKLTWKGRGAVAGTFLGGWVTIIAVFAGVVYFADDEFFAEGEYEVAVVRVTARSRDIMDDFGTELDAVYDNPDLFGPSLVREAAPIFEDVLENLRGIRRDWNQLEPPPDALEFHEAGSDFYEFQIAYVGRALEVRTEEGLLSVFIDSADEEDRLLNEFNRLYNDLLFD